ncbi:hypothetical protein NE237_008992 [Protea cynaroides]|uniref:Uncharacterized protein n=1 Tax=Protea cynaroides TaxID=273540 RepID=A0A9Q0KWY0_9MAGN|nr:hypothetical protein NE237_008992 [Protea cynaroides]
MLDVPSAGVSLYSLSDTAIVDPWYGNPTAMFSSGPSPSSIEPIPLATLPRLSCWGDAPGYMSNEYSSSDEERLEVAWLASKNSCSVFVGGPTNIKNKNLRSQDYHIEFHVEDPSGINLMMDWNGISSLADQFVTCSSISRSFCCQYHILLSFLVIDGILIT